jgi:hypothetical protein
MLKKTINGLLAITIIGTIVALIIALYIDYGLIVFSFIPVLIIAYLIGNKIDIIDYIKNLQKRIN